MADCDKRLFHGLSAWFSSSVRTNRQHLWERGGGELTPFDKAQFLFSENAESEDTKQIFSSEGYLQEHLAVFHSMYVDRCHEQGDRADVKIGDYLLPPTEIQAMVRKQMHYKWEVDKPNPEADKNNTRQQQQQQQVESDEVIIDDQQPSTSSDDGAVGVNKLKKYQGPLLEFLPGKRGFEVICIR